MHRSSSNDKNQLSNSIDSILTYDFASYHIWSKLSLNEQCRLGKVSTLFQPNLFKANLLNETTKLIQHILNDNVYYVKKILDDSPELLAITIAEVELRTHYSMQHVTAFQAALRIKNVIMIELIASYFDKLSDGQKEKLRQFYEELPDGNYSKQSSFDFTIIRDVFDDVTYNKLDDKLFFSALEKFHQDFSNYIKQNKHFNPQDLITAFDYYNYRYYAWSEKNRALFWHQVINYVHSFMPISYAEAFFLSFWNKVHVEPLSQPTLKFKFGNDVTMPFVKSDIPLLDGYDNGPDNSCWGFVVGYRIWGSYCDFVIERQNNLMKCIEHLQQDHSQLIQLIPSLI